MLPTDDISIPARAAIAISSRTVVLSSTGILNGGFGSAIVEFMTDNNYTPKIKRLGIPDKFVEHGSPEELYALLGLDAKGIGKLIGEMLNPKTPIKGLK